MRFKKIHIHTADEPNGGFSQVFKRLENGYSIKTGYGQYSAKFALISPRGAILKVGNYSEVYALYKENEGKYTDGKNDAMNLDSVEDAGFEEVMKNEEAKRLVESIESLKSSLRSKPNGDPTLESALQRAKAELKRKFNYTYKDSAKGKELLAQYEKELETLEREIERKEDQGVTVPPALTEQRQKLQEQIKGAKTMDGTPSENALIRAVRMHLYDAVKAAASLTAVATTPEIKKQASEGERLVDQARRLYFKLQD